MTPLGFTIWAYMSLVASVVRPSVSQVLDTCVQLTPCSCQNSKGVIDLSPLASTGTAKFMDQPDPSGSWFYSWNPCNDFSEGTAGSACQNVAACQSDNTGVNYYSLGDQTTAQFVNEVDKLTLQYSHTTDITRTAIITLTCDQNTEATLDVKGEDPSTTGHYLMTLTSKHACPSGSPGPVPGTGVGISVGSILVIIFFSLTFAYIIAGTVFMVFIRKASGREMFPNYALWVGFFTLIKEGFLFTFTCGKRSGYGSV